MSSDRLRVLFLAAYPAIGGPLPKLAPVLVDGLRRRGCDVLVVGWSAHTVDREGLIQKVIGRSIDLMRVHAWVSKWKPDVIYVATSHNWPALLRDVPLMLTVGRRVPVVLHLHGSQSDALSRPGRMVFKMLSRLDVGRAAVVMLLSREELHEWRRFAPRTCFDVVRNPFVPAAGVELRARCPGSPESPGSPARLLMVARLIAAKGVYDLLAALAEVRRVRPCRLSIAGTGPEEDAIRARILELDLAADVGMLGYVTGEELDRAYRGADIFVLPSYFAEGFPLAVMEAMGYGLPIVTTPIRGCADHLVEGEQAIFVPPRDPGRLASAILELLDDDRLREQMGAAGRAKVAEFAPDRVVPQYFEILRFAGGEARVAAHG